MNASKPEKQRKTQNFIPSTLHLKGVRQPMNQPPLIRTILSPPPSFQTKSSFPNPKLPSPKPNPTIPFHPTQCFSQEEQISSVIPQKQLRKFWKLFFLYCKFDQFN